MTLTDLLIPAIAFSLGIIAAYLFFRQQISAIEGRARNDLERWKTRMHKRYPEGFRQPLAFNAEGQDLRADGPAPAGVSFCFF